MRVQHNEDDSDRKEKKKNISTQPKCKSMNHLSSHNEFRFCKRHMHSRDDCYCKRSLICYVSISEIFSSSVYMLCIQANKWPANATIYYTWLLQPLKDNRDNDNQNSYMLCDGIWQSNARVKLSYYNDRTH